jgi:hypothetical protein
LRQSDELQGAGVFNAIQLKRGDNVAADIGVTALTLATLVFSINYLSGVRMVDGVLRGPQ